METLPDHINTNQQIPAKPIDEDLVIELIDECISDVESYRSKAQTWNVGARPAILCELKRIKLITSGLLGYIKALEDTRKA